MSIKSLPVETKGALFLSIHLKSDQGKGNTELRNYLSRWLHSLMKLWNSYDISWTSFFNNLTSKCYLVKSGASGKWLHRVFRHLRSPGSASCPPRSRPCGDSPGSCAAAKLSLSLAASDWTPDSSWCPPENVSIFEYYVNMDHTAGFFVRCSPEVYRENTSEFKWGFTEIQLLEYILAVRTHPSWLFWLYSPRGNRAKANKSSEALTGVAAADSDVHPCFILALLPHLQVLWWSCQVC